MREETRCHHMGYAFRLAARVLLYASFHRQDKTYHNLCYTSHGALAGTRNSPIGQPWRIDLTTHHIISKRSYHGATSRSPSWNKQLSYNWLKVIIFINTMLRAYWLISQQVFFIHCHRNVFFNETHNVFHLQLYGTGHIVKDHSDKERKPSATTSWATL